MDHTRRTTDRQPTPLEAALAYAARGWSIIPIRPGAKTPACRSWKRYQTAPADEKTLRRWFGKSPAPGLAVVLGGVSGNLVCRDFDDMAGYTAWADAHPELAATLPTVATVRGRHFPRGEVQGLRRRGSDAAATRMCLLQSGLPNRGTSP